MGMVSLHLSCSRHSADDSRLAICEAVVRHMIAEQDKALQKLASSFTLKYRFLTIRDDPAGTQKLIGRFKSESVPVKSLADWPQDEVLLAEIKKYLAEVDHLYLGVVPTNGTPLISSLSTKDGRTVLAAPQPGFLGGITLRVDKITITEGIATVECAAVTGILAATGYEYTLENTDRGWTVTSFKSTWIS